MLEIALCAQHNNGGLSIDKWWQTNLSGFFAVGEVSGSHGVYRPGGSALNAGQVGAARAAEYIAAKGVGAPLALEDFLQEVAAQVCHAVQMGALPIAAEELKQQWDAATKRMSRIGAAIRNADEIAAAAQAVQAALASFAPCATAGANVAPIPPTAARLHRLYDMLLAQYVYLSAMADYSRISGRSRGSALYTAAEGQLPYDTLPELFRFVLDDNRYADCVQEITLNPDAITCDCSWRKVRGMPQKDDFFENVWRSYREHGNIE